MGIPSFVTRFLGFFLLIPGVSRLISQAFGRRVENQFYQWQNRSGFTRFYFSTGPTFVEPEMKDVTPTAPKTVSPSHQIERR